MWDALVGYLYTYGKIIAILYLTGLVIFLIRPYITKRVISSMMRKRISEFSFATSDYIWPKLSKEADAIVRHIVYEMTDNIDQQEENIKKHAVREHNLLYCCKFYMPVNVHNEHLWKAMDYVKDLFYATHGIHLGVKKGDLRRNNIDLSLILEDGSVIDEFSLARHQIKYHEPNLTLPQFLQKEYGHLNDGLVVCIQMSIVTTLTSKVYDYRDHAAVLSR